MTWALSSVLIVLIIAVKKILTGINNMYWKPISELSDEQKDGRWWVFLYYPGTIRRAFEARWDGSQWNTCCDDNVKVHMSDLFLSEPLPALHGPEQKKEVNKEKNIVDYAIFFGLRCDGLESNVKKAIQDGWIPQGGIFIYETQDWIYQAMVKYEE